MRKYPTKQQNNTEKEPPSKMCNMSGCPLLGSMSDNTRGGGPWWCLYHFHQRNPGQFMPEELDRLNKISYRYNQGKREYQKGFMESREEHLKRLLLDKVTTNSKQGNRAIATEQN